MTLQSSGAISLYDVQVEFGGSNPIGINEYYGVASGVPASGTISLYDFYGKSAPAFPGFVVYVFGFRNASSTSVISDTFNGYIVIPGAARSPQSFNVQVNESPDGPNLAPAQSISTLSYYQGGSLNTTWTGNFFAANITFTFGSSSMQFRSYVQDTSSYDNEEGSTSVTGNSPNSFNLFGHVYNLTGGGNAD
jgi:hypothetical protein